MNEIVITDKHNAGKFVRQVIENNFEKFKSLVSVKDKFDYFKSNYPNVNMDYNNFHYHNKTVLGNKIVKNNIKQIFFIAYVNTLIDKNAAEFWIKTE